MHACHGRSERGKQVHRGDEAVQKASFIRGAGRSKQDTGQDASHIACILPVVISRNGVAHDLPQHATLFHRMDLFQHFGHFGVETLVRSGAHLFNFQLFKILCHSFEFAG